MYVYVVEYLGSRIAFKTCGEAEKYIELMWGEKETGPKVMPCLYVGGEKDA